MSGIGSVSGSNSDAYYYQLLLQLSGAMSGQSADATSTGDQSDSASIDTTLTSTGGSSDAGAVDSETLEEQIKKAIEEALYAFLTSSGNTASDDSSTSDSADTTISDSTDSANTSTGDVTDLMKVIQEAIAEVLQQNGIDSQQLASPPPPPPPPPSDTASVADTSNTSESADTTSSTDGSEETDASNTTSDQSDQLIKLMQELLAELQNSSNGSGSVSGYLFDQQS
jgi:hypothetical protein